MDFLKELGIKEKNFGASTGLEWNTTTDQGELKIVSPVDGKHIASVYLASEADYDNLVEKSHEAFKQWRTVPAPKRGEIVRQIGLELRKYKDALGTLVSYEMGKSLQEGKGEVHVCTISTIPLESSGPSVHLISPLPSGHGMP